MVNRKAFAVRMAEQAINNGTKQDMGRAGVLLRASLKASGERRTSFTDLALEKLGKIEAVCASQSGRLNNRLS